MAQIGTDRRRTTYPPQKNQSRSRVTRVIAAAVLIAVLLAVVAAYRLLRTRDHEQRSRDSEKLLTRSLLPSEATVVLGAKAAAARKTTWHPPHVVKVWLTTFRGRTYRVTQLPRCEHMEALISYNPQGETVREAKDRLGGIAASTGSFHNPRSMVLADFLQRKGTIMCPAKTGRCFVAVDGMGALSISGDYNTIKGDPRFSAIALGQRLVPLMQDGFSLAFMNKVTDRIAVGLNENFMFIVQVKTSIWRLSQFMETKLPVSTAINCDGGHVVRGKGPVHIVFRWKKVGDDQRSVSPLSGSR